MLGLYRSTYIKYTKPTTGLGSYVNPILLHKETDSFFHSAGLKNPAGLQMNSDIVVNRLVIAAVALWPEPQQVGEYKEERQKREEEEKQKKEQGLFGGLWAAAPKKQVKVPDKEDADGGVGGEDDGQTASNGSYITHMENYRKL